MAIDNNIDIEDVQSGVKAKLGQFGRSLKKIDLRKQIVDYPFPAIGIALAAGPAVGLLHPTPRHRRIARLLSAARGTGGFPLLREAAVTQLGNYAKSYITGKDDASASSFGGARNEGGNVRYSPSV